MKHVQVFKNSQEINNLISFPYAFLDTNKMYNKIGIQAHAGTKFRITDNNFLTHNIIIGRTGIFELDLSDQIYYFITQIEIMEKPERSTFVLIDLIEKEEEKNNV